MTPEAEIRAIVEAQVPAMAAKDADALVAANADDLVLFNVFGPLREEEDPIQRTREWFDGYDGPIDLEISDLNITAGQDVAFCHYLFRIRGTMTNGTEVDMRVRATKGFRRIDGDWKVTHDHVSVPLQL